MNSELTWGSLTSAERRLMVKIGEWDISAEVGYSAKSRISLVKKGLIENYITSHKKCHVIFTDAGYKLYKNRHGANTVS